MKNFKLALFIMVAITIFTGIVIYTLYTLFTLIPDPRY
ncbi:MAG: Uncharacterised protein [Flavobacterium sp. SCGC AAA160-P02]|nr:MAG: Uncharacterised protein [Flavobacterium sp. SCGC AAA160-P02]